jgi:hypothetical protein
MSLQGVSSSFWGAGTKRWKDAIEDTAARRVIAFQKRSCTS